ncbi:hypothetical protein [Streptomyces sp. 11x1]|uniref:hypothetical protein n=1 Tax=Streptomyces sp. 11x1 TaxID=3038642 RepID=UPI002931B855|nr:hypothetical protein [Streptomyces sp. 11x1]WNZ10885.1 hypothetical protein P8T65_27240 [Streptomyces sp. 11x1]
MESLLAADFPGSAELRQQLDKVEVVAQWGDGSVSADFKVSGDFPIAPIPSGVAPVEAVVVDDSGELVGEILLWVRAGVLSGLEYAWYDDESPSSLPGVNRIIVSK